jgi:hypothetical protein
MNKSCGPKTILGEKITLKNTCKKSEKVFVILTRLGRELGVASSLKILLPESRSNRKVSADPESDLCFEGLEPFRALPPQAAAGSALNLQPAWVVAQYHSWF